MQYKQLAGDDHSLVLDSYGILYGFGKNVNGQLGTQAGSTVVEPSKIQFTSGTIEKIFAGENQSIIINTKGEVYGYGNILNGKLEGIQNAVKAQIGNGQILIITVTGEIYKYNGTGLEKINITNIIDINTEGSKVIAQTADEKAYTWEIETNAPVLENISNVYRIATGTNNSYAVLTNGSVYAKGINNYGQLRKQHKNRQ